MKKELSASSGTFGPRTRETTSVRRPTVQEVLNTVVLPLLLVLLVVGAICYALARSIDTAAHEVKQDALMAVEQKANAGKHEIMESVKKNTEEVKKVGAEFRKHQENSNIFREKVNRELKKENK